MNPHGIGKGFDRSRTNGWYIRSGRTHRKEYFTSELLRDEEYDRRVAEVRLYGQSAQTILTAAERSTMAEMKRLAGEFGYTPMEIFERGLTLVGQKPRRTLSTKSALETFLEETGQRHADKLIGFRRKKDLKNILTKFCAAFPSRDMGSFSRHDIQGYLLGLGVGIQTRVNHARNIRRFFIWASDHGVRIDNPVVITERVKRTPQIFDAAEVARLFKVATKTEPEILDMLVLQWFAGIRPSTTHLMDWNDINHERRHIALRAEISKLKEPEVIEGLPDELWDWMALRKDRKGLISPGNHDKAAKRLHHALGYGLGEGETRWPEDVARHSFASHLFPRVKSIDTVSKVICHRGSRMTLKHYVAKNVQESQAEAYFKVLASIVSRERARARSPLRLPQPPKARAQLPS